MSSQNEEDKIIEALLHDIRIPVEIPKVCLEVGATDGIWLSNTYRLWKELGWKAVLIESNGDNFKNLLANAAGQICVHETIEPQGEHSIDSILENYRIGQVGIMSIDIDGNDYRIFEKLNARPWIVLVEFNATVPPHMELVGAETGNFGCSAKSLGRLAARKGYRVKNITGSNIIMMRNDLVNPQVSPQMLVEWNDSVIMRSFKPHSITYLITDYSGRYLLSNQPVFGYTQPLTQIPEGDAVWPVRTH